jgi:ectoine hydroxylase-related dioxygenase (phytanoyl-CoA dioxygenase family)
MEPLRDPTPRRLSDPADHAAVAPQLASLHDDGYAILESAISEATLEAVAAEMHRINGGEGAARGRNAFAGHETLRAYNLLAKSRAFDPLITHPLVLALVEAWLGDDVQLSIATGITQLPGAPVQDLHRDDAVYTVPRPHAPFSLSVMWAIDDFTAENGATRLVPGSHRDDAGPVPERPTVQAEMPRGSCVLWDGGTLHGSGANRSEAARAGIAVIYNLAWLRQYENQYLALDRDTVRSLSPTYRSLLGYRVVHFTLGLLDGESPLKALDQ